MKYLLLGLILLSSCAKDPVSTSQTDNSNVPVALLFTNKECSVYRFYDDGHYHYYTDCSGTSTTYTTSCGKNCTKTINDDINTGR
jgi:hypothetical protein